MKCPRCAIAIPDYSTSCDCGWQDRVKPNDFNPAGRYVEKKCAVETCYIPAMPGHPKCEYHYIQPHQTAALAKCAELGLDTVDKRRAYVRAMAKKRVFRTFDDIDREPGQDDDERSTSPSKP